MAAKIDKEALIKHRFWILSGVFLVLALIALGMLFMSVNDAVAAKQKDYDAKKKMIDDLRDVKNQGWVDAFQKQDDLVAGKQAQVHRDAWMVQKDIMTWPEGLESDYKDKYFGDDIDQVAADRYRANYKSQLWKAVEVVQPLIPESDAGIVQFAGNSIDGVLQLSKTFPNLPPSKEDIWLAQEDIWVKRELLRAVRDANDSVARFKPVGEEPPAPPKEEKKEAKPAEAAKAGEATKPAEGTDQAADKVAAKPAETKPAAPAAPAKPVDPMHRKFRNQHWEVDLQLTKHDDKGLLLSGTITNITKAKQPLGILLKILTQDLGPDSAGVLLPVDRDPIGAGETWKIPPVVVPSQQIAVEGIMGVEQVLTWKTAPVKRIDVVALSWPSSRTANRSLKPPRWYRPPGAEGEAAGAATAGAPVAGGGEPGSSDMSMGMGGAGAAQVSKNYLPLNRYFDSNEQVRHMPVAMVMVADEEHVPEILSAFANSKLRVQITQVHWQRSRDRVAPLSALESGPAAPGRQPNMPGAGRGRGREPGIGEPGSNDAFRGPGNRMPGMGFGQNIQMPGGPVGGPGGRASGSGGMQMPGGRGGRAPAPGGGEAPEPRRGGMVQGGGMGMQGYFLGGGSAEDEEENLNLVELSIYGIASLYEKFPPKKEAAAAPPADAAATTTPATPK